MIFFFRLLLSRNFLRHTHLQTIFFNFAVLTVSGIVCNKKNLRKINVLFHNFFLTTNCFCSKIFGLFHLLICKRESQLLLSLPQSEVKKYLFTCYSRKSTFFVCLFKLCLIIVCVLCCHTAIVSCIISIFAQN